MQRDDRIISSGAHRIGVRDWGGEGRAAVLIHGAGRNLTDWEPAATHLLPSLRLVGVDLPGHGASDEPEAWDWDMAVDWVEATIAAFALDDPIVIGHSLGGMVAARYGARHPGARGVVNVDGHGLGGPSVPAAFHEFRERLLANAPDVVEPRESGDSAWLDGILEAMRPQVEALGLSWRSAQLAIRRGYAPTADGGWQRRPSNAFLATLPAMGPDLFDIYRSVECPLMIFNCTGKDPSQGFPDELAVAFRDAVAHDLDELCADRPETTIVTVDHGHSVHLEAPELVAVHLLEFINALPAS
jgi:pimeloyl-ACP methyl ester carboxylesterase